MVKTRAGVWPPLPGRPGVVLRLIVSPQRDGQFAEGAPAETPLKSHTFILSDVTCQGVPTSQIFVVALSEVLYMSRPLYLHDIALCSIVHSHKNLLECQAKASYSVLWFMFIYPFALFLCLSEGGEAAV